ncbi:rRNA methyltransferase [Lysinibacillus endophyticus]|uniref:rRNA methyltransferase n=1 Tax=Ureibacillus endophyticus TaxID=1978490 RepID=UPI00209DCD9C|nr:rRNA methyltransferase [Lysinibacillus endophyticus]MCP1144734.1 rRNA methyltransferase [Lysinibacillus endophyticus]
MWKIIDGKLVQSIDESRKEYKTRISKEMIENLKETAKAKNTHIGYLLENGFENILKEDFISFDKNSRPKDRVEFRTTCDERILSELRDFAKRNKLNLNDVIEESIKHINLATVKNAKWRYRKE